tara:strand:+ start:283 stop:384 length:102 start_codon:yes stop_codon:yes gene_type:complete
MNVMKFVLAMILVCSASLAQVQAQGVPDSQIIE